MILSKNIHDCLPCLGVGVKRINHPTHGLTVNTSHVHPELALQDLLIEGPVLRFIRDMDSLGDTVSDFCHGISDKGGMFPYLS